MEYNGKLTLRNNFHNTEATVIVKDGRISPSSLARARRALCGIKGCRCGSIRGKQARELIYFAEDGKEAAYVI